MTKPFRPIALSGKMRAGKSAAARYLVEKYGYTEFAFGDELKADFHRRYPEIMWEPKPRIGYQNHGQLMRALISERYWIDVCFDRIAESLRKFPTRPLISDLRQPNEFDRCKSEGYVIIRVNCPDEIRIERARAAGDNFTANDLNHETERYIDSFTVDYEIQNDGSLDELYAQIDEIIRAITAQTK